MLANLKKYYNLINLADTELEFGVLVAKTNL